MRAKVSRPVKSRESQGLIREWLRIQRADIRVVDLRRRGRHWRALLRTALDREMTADGSTPAEALMVARRNLGYTMQLGRLVYRQPAWEVRDRVAS